MMACDDIRSFVLQKSAWLDRVAEANEKIVVKEEERREVGGKMRDTVGE
jgi:hypothetical protein